MFDIENVRDCFEDYCRFKQTEEDLAYIESTLDSLNFIEAKMDDVLFFNESADEEIQVLMEGAGDVLRNVGQKILDICARIKKFIADAVSKFTDAVGRKKNMDEVKRLVKKDPQKASIRIRNLIAEEKMTLSDFQDLAKYYKDVDDVLDEIKKSEADPKSLTAKWEKFKRKHRKAPDKIDKAGKTVAAAATIVTLGGFLAWGGKKKREVDDTLKRESDMCSRTLQKIDNTLNSLNNPQNRNDLKKCRSKASVLAQVAADVERHTTGNIKTLTKMKAGLMKMADTALRVCNAGKDYAAVQVRAEKHRERNAVSRHLGDTNTRIENNTYAQTGWKETTRVNRDANGNITGTSNEVTRTRSHANGTGGGRR